LGGIRSTTAGFVAKATCGRPSSCVPSRRLDTVSRFSVEIISPRASSARPRRGPRRLAFEDHDRLSSRDEVMPIPPAMQFCTAGRWTRAALSSSSFRHLCRPSLQTDPGRPQCRAGQPGGPASSGPAAILSRSSPPRPSCFWQTLVWADTPAFDRPSLPRAAPPDVGQRAYRCGDRHMMAVVSSRVGARRPMFVSFMGGNPRLLIGARCLGAPLGTARNNPLSFGPRSRAPSFVLVGGGPSPILLGRAEPQAERGSGQSVGSSRKLGLSRRCA